MPRVPAEEWMAGQLRLTTFISSALASSPEEIWESVTGTIPDESSSSPRKGTSQTSGFYELGKLALGKQPDRVDWLLLPPSIDPESPPVDPFQSVGPWQEAVATFATIATGWFSRADLPAIERIAFGSILLHREDTREACYDRLGDYIPTRPPASSSDFLYQINHPLPSETGIENLQINRLSKWSAAAFMGFVVSLIPAKVSYPEGNIAYAVRLELDINTAPDFPGPIPAEQLISVYQEMVDFANEIAANGLLEL